MEICTQIYLHCLVLLSDHRICSLFLTTTIANVSSDLR